jgi:hypothetical protein
MSQKDSNQALPWLAQQQSGQGGNSNQSAPPSRPPFGRPNNPPASQPSQPSRLGSPFGTQNQRGWQMQPIQKTVVRFDLRGMGDPFYRILGRDLQAEYGDLKVLAAALEKGDESTHELQVALNKAWESYRLQGAALVYNWNADTWRNVTTPPPAPAQENGEEELQQTPPPPVLFTSLRSIDLQLILNVLTRSRSQVLLTRAPIVFSQEYLTRSLMSDDPRLVLLAKATGYLEED